MEKRVCCHFPKLYAMLISALLVVIDVKLFLEIIVYRYLFFQGLQSIAKEDHGYLMAEIMVLLKSLEKHITFNIFFLLSLWYCALTSNFEASD